MSTTETKYVGASVLRREDGPLLNGRGTFVDNIQLPGHGAHGRRRGARTPTRGSAA